jgi:hypothetical protein
MLLEETAAEGLNLAEAIVFFHRLHSMMMT